MAGFDDLLDRINYELRYNAPIELVTKQAEYSLIEFCRDSSILKETFTVADFPEDGTSALASTIGVVSSVCSVIINNVIIPDRLYSFSEATGELYIDSSVGATGQDVYVDTIVVPLVSYRDYADSFHLAYNPGIAAHACFELSADASEPWARPDRIPIFKRAYDQSVLQARRRNYRSFQLSG